MSNSFLVGDFLPNTVVITVELGETVVPYSEKSDDFLERHGVTHPGLCWPHFETKEMEDKKRRLCLSKITEDSRVRVVSQSFGLSDYGLGNHFDLVCALSIVKPMADGQRISVALKRRFQSPAGPCFPCLIEKGREKTFRLEVLTVIPKGWYVVGAKK